jgi:hypothetical protein
MTFKRQYDKCVSKFTFPTKTTKQKTPSNKKDTNKSDEGVNIEMKQNLLNKEDDKQRSED